MLIHLSALGSVLMPHLEQDGPALQSEEVVNSYHMFQDASTTSV